MFSTCSLEQPCALLCSLTLPSANLNTIKYVFEEKFSQIISEFSFRGASCEISQPPTSVGGQRSVQLELQHLTLNAYLVKMNSESVNMCVTLYLCMCIFLRLVVCVCVCALTATWTWELFIVFLWRHHREPRIRLFIPVRHGALRHLSACELDVDCQRWSAVSPPSCLHQYPKSNSFAVW